MPFKIDCNSLPLEGNLPFLLCFILYSRANSTYKPPGTYSEGRFNGGFFALRVWGAYILERLIHGGAYLQNFTVFKLVMSSVLLTTESS